MKTPAAIPDSATLVRCLNTNDELALVVRGHQCIEIALDNLVFESLPYRHEKLISRLPFMFEVDLAIGLFSVQPDCRASLLAINTIRNNFAHDLNASISHKDVKDLHNCLPPYLRKTITPGPCDDVASLPVNCIFEIIAAVFIFLEAQVGRVKDQRLWDQATHELVEETKAKYSNRPSGGGVGLAKVNAQIKEKFDRLKNSPTGS